MIEEKNRPETPFHKGYQPQREQDEGQAQGGFQPERSETPASTPPKKP